jgi:hypothetical protein
MGAVSEGAARIGDRNRTRPRTISGWNVGVVEDGVGWHPEPATPPRERQGEVKVRREDIRESVERERGLVRDHARLLGPEPCRHQLFVVGRREVDEAIDAATDPRHAAAMDVVEQKLRRVAGFGSLSGREQTGLCGCRFVESVPVRIGRGPARNVSHALVFFANQV